MPDHARRIHSHLMRASAAIEALRCGELSTLDAVFADRVAEQIALAHGCLGDLLATSPTPRPSQ